MADNIDPKTTTKQPQLKRSVILKRDDTWDLIESLGFSECYSARQWLFATRQRLRPFWVLYNIPVWPDYLLQFVAEYLKDLEVPLIVLNKQKDIAMKYYVNNVIKIDLLNALIRSHYFQFTPIFFKLTKDFEFSIILFSCVCVCVCVKHYGIV